MHRAALRWSTWSPPSTLVTATGVDESVTVREPADTRCSKVLLLSTEHIRKLPEESLCTVLGGAVCAGSCSRDFTVPA